MQAIDKMQVTADVGIRRSAVAGNNRGHAVVNKIAGCRCFNLIAFYMRMHINKPRCYNKPLCVDSSGSVCFQVFLNGSDLPLLNADITVVPGIAGAVDNLTVADNYIVFFLRDDGKWEQENEQVSYHSGILFAGVVGFFCVFQYIFFIKEYVFE